MSATAGGVVTGPRYIGPYELGQQLGGGMSSVYIARNRAFHNQEVVVKILKRDLAQNPRDRRRFEREARVGARLHQHPHVVPVINWGEFGEFPYLVMQRIDGCSLSHLLRGGPLHPSEAVRVAGQMAEALAHARLELGVVHCDMKPSNILIHQGDRAVDAPSMARNLVAYLLDFGVARQLCGHPANANTVTLPEEIFGTPPYMAPETLDPVNPPPPDHRVDVYGLTCVFYECLTGERAFHQGRGQSWREAHRSPDRPRPSDFEVDLAPFNEVVAAGLAVDPAGRIATVEALRERLVSALAAYELTVGSPPPPERTIDIGRPTEDPLRGVPPMSPSPLEPARSWVSRLGDHVASPASWGASVVGLGTGVSVALTATGLEALGLGAAAAAAGYGVVMGVVHAWRGARRP